MNSQIWILLKKNFIWWQRNAKGSFIEITLPIFLVLIISFIKTKLWHIDFKESSSLRIPYATDYDNLQKFPTIAFRYFTLFTEFEINSYMKNCFRRKGGGRIVLAPHNQITQQIGEIFVLLGNRVVFFENDQSISDFVKSKSYGELESGYNSKQFCLGISFDEYDPDNMRYSYNLRFNITNRDIHDVKYGKKIPYAVADFWQFLRLLKKGSITLQAMVEGFIIHKHFDLNLNIGVQKMKNPSYSRGGFSDALDFCIVVIFLTTISIGYLRIIQQVVRERVLGITQNLNNMGVKKSSLFFSTLIFHFSQQSIQGLIFCIFLNNLVLDKISFFVLYFAYLTFITYIILVAIIISAFHKTAKNAIMTGLIVLVLLFLFYLLRDSFEKGERRVQLIVLLSPIGAWSVLTKQILHLMDHYQMYTIETLFDDYTVIRGIEYFIVLGIINILLFFISFYFHVYFNGNFSFSFFLNVKKDLDRLVIKNTKNFEKYFFFQEEQVKEKKTVQVRGLSKQYQNGKVAIRDLDLDLFEGEIFSLLGHNGAGKSTFVSILCGNIKKTKGSILIKGNDISENHKILEGKLGVCPQTNPIIPYMTVIENLQLYISAKNAKNNSAKEILISLDLWHKKNYLACNLSGGQKRKLCIAFAFVGDSELILLDEPTSGLDAKARRLLWECLRKLKRNKIVLLTTHNMEEADFLGDRIGLMCGGELISYGSSLFLKEIFGKGYCLSIVKKRKFKKKNFNQIKGKIMEIEKSVFLSDIGTELKFSLDQEKQWQFHELFQYLEDNKEELGIESYGISISSLEEVFVNLHNIYKKKQQEILNLRMIKNTKQTQMQNLSENSFENPNISQMVSVDMSQTFTDIQKQSIISTTKANKSNNSSIPNNNEEIMAITKIKSPWDNSEENNFLENSFLKLVLQIKALIKKKIIFFKRDSVSTLCEQILPLLIVILGFSLTKIQFFHEPKPIAFEHSLYSQNFKINNITSKNFGSTQNFLQFFDFDKQKAELIDTHNRNAFDRIIYQSEQEEDFGIYIEELEEYDIEYTIFVNSTSVYAQYVAMNQMNQAIFRSLKNTKTPYIKGRIEAFGLTKQSKFFEALIDGFVASMLLPLGLTFIPASIVVFLIREKETNSKHLQIISGMNAFSYWFSNFIIDYFKYSITSILIFGLSFIFRLQFFLEGEKWKMFLSLLVVNGLSFLPFIYFITFFFKTPSKGQIFIFLLNFFFGIILVMVSMILRSLEETRYYAEHYFIPILKFIPFYNFSNGIFVTAQLNLMKFVYNLDETPEIFSKFGALPDLVSLCWNGIFFIFLIFVLEIYELYRNQVPILNKNSVLQEIQREKIDQPDSEAVLEEEKFVKDNEKKYFSVKVTDLVKIYHLKNTCGGKKNQSYKTAVKKITFGVEKGSVFGLLGTNGAGKSTTFKMLTGDLAPTFGKCIVDNNEIPSGMLKIRNKIGYCPQRDALLPVLTVYEHLQLFSSLKGIKIQFQKKIIFEMMKKFDLLEYQNVKSSQLSGGNKRKLSVSIAFLGKPEIIFLDEPGAGMDPCARRKMWEIVSEEALLKKKCSIILTTHSMQEAEALSSKLAILVEGRIKTIGSVQQLKNLHGMCFELDIKIQKPDLQFFENIENCPQFIKQNQFNRNQVKSLCGNFLEIEISEFWEKYFEDKLVVEKEYFLEWMYYEGQMIKIFKILKNSFETEIIEKFRSYLRLKVVEKVNLSQIFRLLTENKKDLKFESFQVKQVSLEQIFMNLADNIAHDD